MYHSERNASTSPWLSMVAEIYDVQSCSVCFTEREKLSIQLFFKGLT